MEKFATVEVTPEDKLRFPHHTEGSIMGIKVIESIPDETLMLLPDDPDMLERLRLHIGENTNPSWVIGQVAEELYNRDLIDEVKFDELYRR